MLGLHLRLGSKVGTIVFGGLSLMSPLASAAEPVGIDSGASRESRPSAVAPFEVGAGVQSALQTGTVCRWQESDVESCQTDELTAGFLLEPRWRLSAAFSVGARGGISWSNYGVGDSRQYVTVEAEGRWHFLGSGSVDPWLGLDAGLAVAIDRVDAMDLYPSSTFTHAAPMIGGGIGVDFRIGPFLALTPQLRGAGLLFDGRPVNVSDGSSAARGSPSFSNMGSISLAMTATVLFGPRI